MSCINRKYLELTMPKSTDVPPDSGFFGGVFFALVMVAVIGAILALGSWTGLRS